VDQNRLRPLVAQIDLHPVIARHRRNARPGLEIAGERAPGRIGEQEDAVAGDPHAQPRIDEIPEGLDAVAPTPDAYLQTIRDGGVINPWSPFWDAYYTYELEQLPDGSWSPTTSRAAAEEDLYQEWPRDWSDHWRALTMPTVVVRAIKPLNGALIVPDRAIEALAATNPAVRVVNTPESNHFTCIVDPITRAAIREISQP